MTAADQIGILVTAMALPNDRGSNDRPESFSTSQATAIAQAFGDGFRAHLPDAKVQRVNDSDSEICADLIVKGARIAIGSEGAHKSCRALVGYRYLILLTGSRRTSSAPQGFGNSNSGGGILGFGTAFQQDLSLRAQAYGTSTGVLACERDRSANTSSYVGLAIIGNAMGALPIPLIAVPDETAYWVHTASRLGYVTAGCFAAPDADYELPTSEIPKASGSAQASRTEHLINQESSEGNLTFPQAVWWFNGNEPVPGRMRVEDSRLVFLERLSSGAEAPYDLNYARITAVSLVKRDRVSGPLISIQLNDGTAEYFSIAGSGPGTVDNERTRATFELIRRKVSTVDGAMRPRIR